MYIILAVVSLFVLAALGLAGITIIDDGIDEYRELREKLHEMREEKRGRKNA